MMYLLAAFDIDHIIPLDLVVLKLTNYQASGKFHITQNLVYMMLLKILESSIPLADPKKYILLSAI